MTTLSPVADDLTILEQHWDDEIPCLGKTCESAATVRVIIRCCGATGFYCPRHFLRVISVVERHMATPKGAQCRGCGAVWPRGTRFDDAFRTVPL